MISTFVIAVLLLLAASVWFLSRPLRSKSTQAADVSREHQLAEVYRQKLEQLRQQRQRGELDQAQFDEARDEIEHALAEELPDSSGQASSSNNSAIVWLIALVLPLVSLALYFDLGRPDTFIPVLAQQTQNGAPPSVDAMIAKLENRLRQNPNDIDGWLMLGRSYIVLQQFDKAQAAYSEAVTRTVMAPEPDILLDYAESIARGNGNVFSDAATASIEKALEIDPKHRRGRWLYAVAAFQRGDNQLAIARWTELLNEPGVAADERQLLNQFIARAQSDSSQADASEDTRAASITVTVKLAEALRQQVSASDTLFIYARAVGGPPMPLAVKRLTADKLPVTVTLGDSDAMMQQMRLSQFDQVFVTARISKTGSATPTPGDLEGASDTLQPQQRPSINIVIDQQRP